MPRLRLPRRHFLYVFVVILCALGLSSITVWNLWWLGRRSVRGGRKDGSRTHRVVGGSMAPTLWGEHFEVICPACAVPFKLDASATSSLAHDPRLHITCWHCGTDIDRPSGPTRPGDFVDVEPIAASTPLDRGQLVIVRIDDELHIKRLLGIPGDTISLAQDAVTVLQLSVNGVAASSRSVTIAVDRDSHRAVSRWSGWERVGTSWRYSLSTPPAAPPATPPSTSLVYTNHNVHDFDKVTAIMDDCPANALLARPLYPASLVQLRFQLTCSVPVRLVTLRQERDFAAGTHDVVFCGPSDEVSIDVVAPARTPLMERADDSADDQLVIDDLQLDRLVDYRLRRTDDSTAYPLRLAHDDYFVVGDNVPISIDSRNYGPIQRRQIIATIAANDHAACDLTESDIEERRAKRKRV